MLAPGTYIAVSHFTGRADELGYPETDILLINEAGELAAPLVIGPGEDARLSPDGRYLAYTERFPHSATALSIKLLALDLCTGESIPMGLPPGRIYGYYSWDAPATQLAVAISGEVYVLPFPHGDARRLTDCHAIGQEATCAHPEISPDGRYVAYTVSFDNPDGDPRTGIYVADTSCPPRKEGCAATVSPLLLPPSYYVWSPDSTALAVADGAAINVYAMPSGSPLAVLPHSLDPADTASKGLLWPSSGNDIVSIAPGGEMRLVDANTGIQREVTLEVLPLGPVGALRLSGGPKTPCTR